MKLSLEGNLMLTWEGGAVAWPVQDHVNGTQIPCDVMRSCTQPTALKPTARVEVDRRA
jgi:hypothetical protein